jgi:hypothetical protein
VFALDRFDCTRVELADDNEPRGLSHCRRCSSHVGRTRTLCVHIIVSPFMWRGLGDEVRQGCVSCCDHDQLAQSISMRWQTKQDDKHRCFHSLLAVVLVLAQDANAEQSVRGSRTRLDLDSLRGIPCS